MTKLWRWNAAAVRWDLVRECHGHEAAEWQRIFECAESGATFFVAARRPKHHVTTFVKV
jgi:hypothetical protein